MKVLKTQFDDDFEDDGLYTITFWDDLNPPNYISLARDNFDNPTMIYIELLDQKYGYETKDIQYSFNGNVLIFNLDRCFEFLDNKKVIEMEIDERDIQRIEKKLISIFHK